jgi:hypothetical protein
MKESIVFSEREFEPALEMCTDAETGLRSSRIPVDHAAEEL